LPEFFLGVHLHQLLIFKKININKIFIKKTFELNKCMKLPGKNTNKFSQANEAKQCGLRPKCPKALSSHPSRISPPQEDSH
jgi:hypothetical protein